VFFLKEKLVYDFTFKPKDTKHGKERGSLFKGLRQKHKVANHEVKITKELVAMQKALDLCSRRYIDQEMP